MVFNATFNNISVTDTYGEPVHGMASVAFRLKDTNFNKRLQLVML
jgi:hypothetical protein